MKILFDERVAQVYDKWLDTKKGSLADSLEKELMLRTADLKSGESVLDAGCGTGNYLQFFRTKGLKAIGVDCSLPMLLIAKKNLGRTNGLCLGKAEDLPLKSKSFDTVALITTLEFVGDPKKALREAARVSREQILLGVLNKYSLTATARRLKGIFHASIYNKARFYSIWELKQLLTKVLGKGNLNWGSALILPLSFQEWFGGLERILSFRKNPFGAFLAVGVSIKKIS